MEPRYNETSTALWHPTADFAYIWQSTINVTPLTSITFLSLALHLSLPLSAFPPSLAWALITVPLIQIVKRETIITTAWQQQ